MDVVFNNTRVIGIHLSSEIFPSLSKGKEFNLRENIETANTHRERYIYIYMYLTRIYESRAERFRRDLTPSLIPPLSATASSFFVPFHLLTFLSARASPTIVNNRPA